MTCLILQAYADNTALPADAQGRAIDPAISAAAGAAGLAAGLPLSAASGGVISPGAAQSESLSTCLALMFVQACQHCSCLSHPACWVEHVLAHAPLLYGLQVARSSGHFLQARVLNQHIILSVMQRNAL